jgi:hypothetical protein
MNMEEKKSKGWILNYVLMLIQEVKEFPKEQRETVPFRESIAKKHQTFFYKFPHLLMMICEEAEKFDLKQLIGMLNNMEEIDKGEKDLEETNKMMGQKYFDKFVKPKIDKL